MGLKAVGLCFRERPHYAANLKVLKTVCQAFGGKRLLFGSRDSLEVFDLEVWERKHNALTRIDT